MFISDYQELVIVKNRSPDEPVSHLVADSRSSVGRLLVVCQLTVSNLLAGS